MLHGYQHLGPLANVLYNINQSDTSGGHVGPPEYRLQKPVGILGHSPWPTERRTQGPKQTHQSQVSLSCTTRETHATTQMMARNPDVGMYPSRGTGKTVHPVNESTTRIPRVTVITTLKTIFAVIILTLLQRGPPSSQLLSDCSPHDLHALLAVIEV